MHGLTCDCCDGTLLVAGDVRYLMRCRSRAVGEARWMGEPREWDLCPPCQRRLLRVVRDRPSNAGACAGCPAEDPGCQVEVVLFAAYDVMEIPRASLERDLDAEWDRLLEELEKLSGDEAQDQVYRQVILTMCSRCKFRWFADPFR